jgi:predicted Zn-dependent protease
LLNDIELTSYVNRIGQKIVAGLGEQPFTYRFYVVRDGRVNAFAVPGGYIYVNGGLLTRAASDDEIAGVLGHEVAHVHAHHLARQQEATQILNYATFLGMLLSAVQPAVGAGAAALQTATQLEYRREFEQEADYLGTRYMRQAGYDPRGMLDFLRKMLDDQHGSPATATPYLLSHPLTDKRLTNLEGVLRTHQADGVPRRPRSLDLERVQLLVRIRSVPAQEVVADYRRMAEAAPENAWLQYLLGVAYFEAGLFDSALAAFQRAHGTRIPGVERDFGRTLFRLRQSEKALPLLRAAVEVDAADAVAWFDLARVLQDSGDDVEATRAYGRAVDLAPDFEAAHYSLGVLSGRAGREGDGYYHLGMAHYLRGELDQAYAQFQRAEPLAVGESPRAEDIRAYLTELGEVLGKR